MCYQTFETKKQPSKAAIWCRRPDSNRYGLRRRPLKTVCLPISPLRLYVGNFLMLSRTRQGLGVAPEADAALPANADTAGAVAGEVVGLLPDGLAGPAMGAVLGSAMPDTTLLWA